MPLQIVEKDITAMKVDVIVNAANTSLLGGGGVDGAIHRAAGPALLKECRMLGGCETGDAKITGAGNLPCRYVIHTVGPVYRDGRHGEPELLRSCYRKSLQIAAEHHCKTAAFPLISSGVYGYPKAEALRIAVDTAEEFLRGYEMTVFLVIFDRNAYRIADKLYTEIRACIADAEEIEKTVWERRPAETEMFGCVCRSVPDSALDQALAQMDETFSEMLLRKIDASGMTDAQCYRKANIDRKLFSKIRGDRQYQPSKPTVIAFALALELSLAETGELLRKAGFALSHSSRFDIIIEYFIAHGCYNVFQINEALFAFDEHLLGA